MSQAKYFNFGKGSKFVPPTKKSQQDVKKDETLAVIHGAALAISKARTLDDTILLKAMLNAAEVQARKKGLADLEKEVIEYKFMLQDKTGQIIEELKESGELHVGRPEKGTPGVQLKSLGLSKNESSQAQKFHNLPEDQKAEVIEAAKSKVGKRRTRKTILDGVNPAHVHDFVLICSKCGARSEE